MKKVINGKMYNTETAKCVLETCGGQSGSFNYWEEELYLKKTGEFFLYYYGGPLTKYAIHDGNETSGSYGILPLTEEKAKKFVEKYGDGDDYIKIFGEVEE